jgi:hypothetical protein
MGAQLRQAAAAWAERCASARGRRMRSARSGEVRCRRAAGAGGERGAAVRGAGERSHVGARGSRACRRAGADSKRSRAGVLDWCGAGTGAEQGEQERLEAVCRSWCSCRSSHTGARRLDSAEGPVAR